MYIVIEMQTNGESTAILSNVFTDRGLALQKYYAILSAAAVSQVEVHTAMVVDELGYTNYMDSFDRRVKNEEEETT